MVVHARAAVNVLACAILILARGATQILPRFVVGRLLRCWEHAVGPAATPRDAVGEGMEGREGVGEEERGSGGRVGEGEGVAARINGVSRKIS